VAGSIGAASNLLISPKRLYNQTSSGFLPSTRSRRLFSKRQL
jgi:hypothetical protein